MSSPMDIPLDVNALIEAKLTHQQYMRIYAVVREIPSTFDSGKELYIWFTDATIQIAQSVCSRVDARAKGAELLSYYLKNWENFQHIASLIGVVLASFQQNWLKTECRVNPSYVSIGETMDQLWYVFCFKPLHKRLEAAMVELIDQERSGIPIDSMLVQRYWKALVDLHPPGIEDIRIMFRNNLGAYIRFYEGPYIIAMLKHIERQTRGLDNEMKIREYISKLDELAKLEVERSEMYMHEYMRESRLRQLISDYFASGKITKLILDEAGKMFKEISKDAGKLIMETSSNPEAPLREAFLLIQGLHEPKIVKSFGRALVSHMSDNIVQAGSAASTSNDRQPNRLTLIDAILAANDANSHTLSHYFGPTVPESLVTSTEEALKLAIKSKAIRVKSYVEYYHSLLVKSKSSIFSENDGAEATLTMHLNRALKVIRNLPHMSYFMRLYHIRLARRIISNNSSSLRFEQQAILSLRPFLLLEDWKRVSDMCEDAVISEDLTEKFVGRLDADPASVKDSRIIVFEYSAWPGALLPKEKPTLRIPQNIAYMHEKFNEFYQYDVHKGRKLSWDCEHSSVTVNFYFPHAPKVQYTMVMNIYQLAILTLFTDRANVDTSGNLRLTKKRICQLTDMQNDQLTAGLEVLCRTKILVKTSSGLEINKRFNSKAKHINLQAIRHKQAQMEDNRAYMEDKRFQMDAITSSAMAILKCERTIVHNTLFTRVTKMVTSKGYPTFDNDVFKAAIDKLIFKEHVERDEQNRDVYNYVA
ncbi:ubiquitin ligase (cullin) of SCF [Coemansia sp. RSA 1933]|nr:ubiquitin ligase (cullin) of SCF [Coemansia sp. RSA 1933]